MGNSSVYRIHTGEDLDEAYAVARRVLALAPPCCEREVNAYATSGSHDLERYVGVADVVSVSFPAGAALRAVAALEGFLPPEDRPVPFREDGSARVWLRLSGELAAALRGLPAAAADVSTGDHPLPSSLPDRFLPLVGADPAQISWMTCWPGIHHESGFELGVNGAELWHPRPVAGHSVYLHVPPDRPELAANIAAAVGAALLGPAATGW